MTGTMRSAASRSSDWNDALELGVIDEVGYSQDEKGGLEAYIKGNFAEVLLAGRVVESMAVLSGNLEGCMRELVRRAAIEPDDPGRAIPHLKLGEASGLQGKLDVQTTGAVLSDKLYEVGNTFGVSHRVRYDFQTNDLLFEVWQGKDRRDSQEEHSWAVFSNAFCNVRSMSYTRDGSAYRNFAYVAGAGEGMDRVTVPVDMVPPGGQRQEIWVDARDLQPEDAEGNAIPWRTIRRSWCSGARRSWPGTFWWSRWRPASIRMRTWRTGRTLTWGTFAPTSTRISAYPWTSASRKWWRHTRAGRQGWTSRSEAAGPRRSGS